MSRPLLPPMQRLAATIAIALALGACNKPASTADQAAKAPAEAPAPTKPTLGSFGFDVAGMDKSATPGDNFFQYANGTWFKNTQIPADRSGYNSFTLLAEKAALREREIIEESAKDANATGEAALIRDYYNAYMGPSGSGKSTLMNIIGCLDVPDGGSYQLEGQAVDKMSEDQLADIRNRKIGFVFQTFNLVPRVTVFKNVELPLIYAGKPRAERKRIAEDAINVVGLTSRMLSGYDFISDPVRSNDGDGRDADAHDAGDYTDTRGTRLKVWNTKPILRLRMSASWSSLILSTDWPSSW